MAVRDCESRSCHLDRAVSVCQVQVATCASLMIIILQVSTCLVFLVLEFALYLILYIKWKCTILSLSFSLRHKRSIYIYMIDYDEESRLASEAVLIGVPGVAHRRMPTR